MIILHSNAAIATRLLRFAATGAFACSADASCARSMRAYRRFPRGTFTHGTLTV
jgi:hypothetical protein